MPTVVGWLCFLPALLVFLAVVDGSILKVVRYGGLLRFPGEFPVPADRIKRYRSVPAKRETKQRKRLDHVLNNDNQR